MGTVLATVLRLRTTRVAVPAGVGTVASVATANRGSASAPCTPLDRPSALLTIPGCGALTAAKLVGETAGVARFGSKSAYARWNGTAPQPASSGTTNRFRLSRGGNRQVNAALHRIAITQARTWPQGRDFIAKRIRQGNTTTEALRVLRRRLSDVVYRTLLTDEHAAQPERDIHTHIDLT